MKSALALVVAILATTSAPASKIIIGHHLRAVASQHSHANSDKKRKAAGQRRLQREKRFIEENATSQNLGYIQFTDRTFALYGRKRLVPLPQNLFVKIDPTLGAQYRWVTPDTAAFVVALGHVHYGRFPKAPKIQVNSALRTIERQKELREHNLNAAPATGPMASLHERGNTVDIAYLSLRQKGEQAYVSNWLALQKRRGYIDYQVEKMSQRMYHIIVYRFPKQAAKHSPQGNGTD